MHYNFKLLISPKSFKIRILKGITFSLLINDLNNISIVMSFFVCDLIINIQVAINLIKTVQQIKAQQQVHKYRICLS